MKRIPPLLAAAALLAPAAAAQFSSEVDAELVVRRSGEVVRAALVLEIEHGWHLYHTDLGHPKAVGKPTTVTFSGAGVEWGDPVFPEPFPLSQTDWESGEEIFILSHEGTVVVHCEGLLDSDEELGTITAKISGLVCDDKGCVPYDDTVTAAGKGPDRLFAVDEEEAVVEADPGAQPEAAAPEADVLVSGEADATLYTRKQGGKLRAAIVIAIDDDWHLYHADKGHADAVGRETRVVIETEGVSWAEPTWPEPLRLDQSYMGPGVYINAHEGTIVLYAEGTLAAGAGGKGTRVHISGQTCKEVCTDYDETLVDRGPGPDEVWADWDERMAAGPGAAGGGASGSEKKGGLLRFLLAAVGWGLFALLMPCTYPMIPITISFFTKQAAGRGKSPLSLSLAYGAGIVLIFVLIGVLFGSVIIPFANHPVTNLVIGLAFVYFALALFGVVTMEPPRFLMNVAGKASTTGGFAGVFLMGAALVVTSFTCTGPFVGSLLALGAEFGLAEIALGMGVFGATMAIPFVLLSLVPNKLAAMPRSGEWMNTLKHFLGFVELAAALKFISNADVAWGWQVISREVFFAAWALIFLIAGVFLLKGSAGLKRRIGGALCLVFALYCGWIMRGHDADPVMTALAPPYSGGRFTPEWFDPDIRWTLIADDYDEAARLARVEQKLVLVNFTGHL